MLLSRMFLPTLKESPSDAEVVSHKLMIRAGMIRRVAAGIYNLLPLGLNVVRRVEGIVREEMNSAGAEEVLMPMVQPSELWKESGRWELYGKELLRLNDRHGREFCLGPTHEEAITDMVRHDVRSYKELPLNLYQIQTKFRDEIRPRFGLMRGREFLMKDAYSFHATEESADEEYQNMFDTYTRIFKRVGLEFKAVEAETGAIGGAFSHEFMVLADTGEDAVASCIECDYAANVERAAIRDTVKAEAGKSQSDIEQIETPGKKSVEDVSEFLGVEPRSLIKTLIYETGDGAVALLVRGDRDINEAKAMRLLGLEDIELAGDETVKDVTGAPTGFAGPVGLKIPIYADFSVRGMTNAVTGANKVETHIKGVSALRDFEATYADISVAKAGDPCPRCDGSFEVRRGIEVGHIFKLGTKYSESMGATFLDENGKDCPMIMGCYGIGIGRIAAAAVEQNHDDNGIIWPVPLAPFKVHIVPVKVNDPETMRVARELYDDFKATGYEPILDDRNERAGFKFKDADLIGAPIRITVSTKTLAENSVELKQRGGDDSVLVELDKLSARVTELLSV
jgi:prolyl-tRNA synthetase